MPIRAERIMGLREFIKKIVLEILKELGIIQPDNPVSKSEVVGKTKKVATTLLAFGLASLMVCGIADAKIRPKSIDSAYAGGDAWTFGTTISAPSISSTGDNTFGSTAGSDITIGNSTGNVTVVSDNADFTLTDATDNVFQLVNSSTAVLLDIDLGTTDTITIGSGAEVLTFTSGSGITSVTASELNVIGLLVVDNNNVNTDSATPLVNIYSHPHHDTTAVVGEVIAVRGSTRIDVDSTSGDATGAKFQAGCMGGGYTLRTVRGVHAEVVNKIATGASETWTDTRALELNLDLNQGSAGHTTTFTNAAGIWMKWNLPTAGTYTTVTTGYGIYLDNEAVGGTGQSLDAAIYIKDTSMSGGIKGWDVGVDLSGVAAGFTTTDIKLSSGAYIMTGTADPNGSVTGADGSIYIRQGTSSADTCVYVNTNGATAWTALIST